MANPSPALTFTVDLDLFSTEAVGTNTNVRNPSILHPDQHQNSPDNGRSETGHRKNTRVTWISGQLVGENRMLGHGDSFTLYGQKAIYVRDMYGVGYAPAERAFLTVASA